MSRTGFDGCAVLREHPVFDRLPFPLTKWLSARARLQSARADEVIFSRGDSGRSFFLVVRGTVKICVISAEGREAVFTIAHRGDSFGEIAAVDGSTRTADAIAKTDCELMAIDRNDLLHLARREPAFSIALGELVCSRYRWISTKLEEALLLDFSKRLAKTLLWLGEKGLSSEKIVTQKEIGQMLGGSRETTNKCLRNWQRRNWVRFNRASGIEILRPEALNAIANAEVIIGPLTRDERDQMRSGVALHQLI
jgi:CRP/FNR family cyclic AMP-dependent transcriptional regulator